MIYRNKSEDTPATLDAVVEALLAASQHDEQDLQEMASEGSLRMLFPFRPHAIEVPPDTIPREQLRRASPLPLDPRARKALIWSSMPSSARTNEFNKIVASWDKDKAERFGF